MSITLSTYLETLDEGIPPTELSPALLALWWAGKEDWKEAHRLIQAHEGEADCDWVHAWLHRQEDDIPNARYWYRRAHRTMQHGDPQTEWRAIVTSLLAGSGY